RIHPATAARQLVSGRLRQVVDFGHSDSMLGRRPSRYGMLTDCGPVHRAQNGVQRLRGPGALAAAAALLWFAACSDDEPAGPTPPPSAIRYSIVDAGYYHTCALTPSGRAHCWGRNSFGTLGDGTTDDRTLPTPVDGGPALVSLDAGAGHNCALTAAGAAWCWGLNDEGQVGDGTF